MKVLISEDNERKYIHIERAVKKILGEDTEIVRVSYAKDGVNRFHGDISWDAGYTKVKIQPITRRIFEDLCLLYPQKEHTFKCG